MEAFRISTIDMMCESFHSNTLFIVKSMNILYSYMMEICNDRRARNEEHKRQVEQYVMFYSHVVDSYDVTETGLAKKRLPEPYVV